MVSAAIALLAAVALMSVLASTMALAAAFRTATIRHHGAFSSSSVLCHRFRSPPPPPHRPFVVVDRHRRLLVDDVCVLSQRWLPYRRHCRYFRCQLSLDCPLRPVCDDVCAREGVAKC